VFEENDIESEDLDLLYDLSNHIDEYMSMLTMMTKFDIELK